MMRARSTGLFVFLIGLLPAALAQAQENTLVDSDHPLLISAQSGERSRLPVTFDADDLPAAEPHPLLQNFEPSPQDAAVPAQVQMPEDSPAVDTSSPCMTVLTDPTYRMANQFPAGQWAMQYLTGVLITPYHFGIPIGQQVHMNFLMENVRFSRVIRGNDPSRFLRGSSEFVVELHCMPIIYGPGTTVIGGAVYGRYNFSFTSRERLVFYLQAGGGCMYSDAYLYPPTSLVSAFNFIIHIGGGCHYFINRSLSLDLESTYYHYSNGGIVMPNVSINGANEFIGFTYYFGRK